MAGWLKHGNPPGDFSMARRCGAGGHHVERHIDEEETAKTEKNDEWLDRLIDGETRLTGRVAANH